MLKDLLDLVGSGAVVIVGSGDASGVPELTRAWGLHLAADRDDVIFCVPSASARQVLANLESTGRVACTITNPLTYRSFQVKGRVTAMTSASADDLARVAEHQRTFVDTVAQIGLSRDTTPRLFSNALDDDAGMTAVRMTVESLFEQTPGPSAGARL